MKIFIYVQDSVIFLISLSLLIDSNFNDYFSRLYLIVVQFPCINHIEEKYCMKFFLKNKTFYHPRAN